MSDYPGLLIAFEGIDNAGKTTQVQRIGNWVRSQGRDTLISRELGTSIGQCFRAEFEAGKLSPRVKALLFAADRYHRLETEISPALGRGIVVLADRWALSSMVYRSVEGQGMTLVKYINEGVTQPDMTFLIDVDPDLAYQRGQAANRHSPYGLDFLGLARKRYLELVQQEKLVVVDGSKSIEQVARNIMGHLVPLLENLK